MNEKKVLVELELNWYINEKKFCKFIFFFFLEKLYSIIVSVYKEKLWISFYFKDLQRKKKMVNR